ncbi:hypothetical protein RJT34_32663 [Clitoria ternatea]|uniref:Uncharacterized protein n=1 Tax=Clitoria ternatea TaxID=43366 RepID=A0AAN9EWV9_CLITE
MGPTKMVKGLALILHLRTQVDHTAEVAFKIAQKRRGKLCSVDKANVLENQKLVGCKQLGEEILKSVKSNVIAGAV